MNDKTSPPEESDDRTGVATGQQASSAGPASTDAAPSSSTGGNGRAGAASAGGNGRDAGRIANADAPTAKIRLPKPANGSTAATVNAVPSSGPAGQSGSTAGSGSTDGAATRTGPGEQAAGQVPDALPTTPKPGSRNPAAPEPSGPVPVTRSSDDDPTLPANSRVTESAPPAATTPAPATGPVPIPGPAAANPPPWNRVPGRTPERPEHQASAQPPGPAGGLLDGPTTYLMPESGSSTDTTEPRSKSWSPVRSGRTRPPRRAALQLKRLDPWSMLKLGLVLAVVIFFIWLVAVGVLYGVLDGMGVWDRLNGTYADLVSGEAPTGSPLISAGRVFGLAAVIGAINSLLFAVAVTIGAFVYNVSADLVGGVEVTLSERD